MNPIELLTRDHRDIKRELFELETIMQSDEINYPNLVHVFRRLHDLWNNHEELEEKLFPVLEKEKIKIPVEKMLFEHKDLRQYYKKILKAIDSGSEFEIKEALQTSGKEIYRKLKHHIKDEDEVLYTITLEEFSPEELHELWNVVK